MMSTKNLVRLLIVLFIYAVISSVASAQFIIRVDGDQGSPNPPGQGSDWGPDAYEFPQDALARAQVLLDQNPGSTAHLWVAATVEANPYRPDQGANPTPGDRGASFHLINRVTIFGGFPPGGGDGTFGARNPDLYETVLSGEIGDLGIFDNSYHVVTCIGVSAQVGINGLTISDGNANLGCTTVCFGGGMLIAGADPLVVRCTFTNNYALRGGAIIVYGFLTYVAEPIIINCKITENSAGFFGGGGMAIGQISDVKLINTIMIDNSTTGHGGAILVDLGGIITLTNSTLSANEAVLGGGGITVWNPSQATLENCIVWGNNPLQIETDDSGVVVAYSDVEGDWFGTGNIDADPLFVDPGNGDFTLKSCSPAVDAADNDALQPDFGDLDEDGDPDETTPVDLDLNERRIDNPAVEDTGNGIAPIVDMGAYEFVPDPCPWDLNGDGVVGILDLLALLAAWGIGPGGPPDFDCDGDVDVVDLEALRENWGRCPGVAGDPPKQLEEELTDTGLDMNDWNLLLFILQNGTNEAIDNALCWFGYYINGCDGGTRQACSDHDPFTDCVGDLNGDCCVDKLDAQILLNQMGPCPAGPGACLGDLNGDCVVDKLDHRDLLDHFGACPTTGACPSPPPGCGTTTTEALQGAVTQMGFAQVADYQAHISATSEGEAFVCACVLQALLEAQP
ncbi:MAG: hypothetical protein IH983_07890 [Planctomycetes bacterium]|nr:hypothetical protein [Planctomycetota bacterium]